MCVFQNKGEHRQTSRRSRFILTRNTLNSVPIMRYLLSMLQVLIIVVQHNLEARQRVSNVRGEFYINYTFLYLLLFSHINHVI